MRPSAADLLANPYWKLVEGNAAKVSNQEDVASPQAACGSQCDKKKFRATIDVVGSYRTTSAHVRFSGKLSLCMQCVTGIRDPRLWGIDPTRIADSEICHYLSLPCDVSLAKECYKPLFRAAVKAGAFQVIRHKVHSSASN
eukprot:2190641-Amphidinium_carterae.1